MTQAVPIGLIINEAFTNAFKYAFINGRNGEINIRMKYTTGSNMLLQISDNGIGFPKNIDWRNSQSLVMSMMRGLAKQIDGHFELMNGQGTTLKITFEGTQSLQT